jgi:hypothetical protein
MSNIDPFAITYANVEIETIHLRDKNIADILQYQSEIRIMTNILSDQSTRNNVPLREKTHDTIRVAMEKLLLAQNAVRLDDTYLKLLATKRPANYVIPLEVTNRQETTTLLDHVPSIVENSTDINTIVYHDEDHQSFYKSWVVCLLLVIIVIITMALSWTAMKMHVRRKCPQIALQQIPQNPPLQQSETPS